MKVIKADVIGLSGQRNVINGGTEFLKGFLVQQQCTFDYYSVCSIHNSH
ncbi:hypothetical protein [Chitinophaga arvensicola]|nr:hypothetical protein [Chitinophaga arvensicola]